MISIGYVEHPLNDRFVRDTEMDCWTMEYLWDGHVSVSTPRGYSLYGTNVLMLIPPNTPYAVEWGGGPGRWRESFVIFDPPKQWTAYLSWPLSECGLGIIDLPNLTAIQEVETAFDAAYKFQISTRTNRHLFVHNAIEQILLTADEVNPKRGYTQRDERVERVLSYIAANYAQPLDLEILARQVYLSPSRFSHLFRAQMQQTPMQYLEEYRLERAAERLLLRQNSIEQVAESVGFVNACHFATRFRRSFGCSPSRYRRNPK